MYVTEQGCQWRGLPKRFGNWHTNYTRMNRWSKGGVLDRVFAQLQHAQIVRLKMKPWRWTALPHQGSGNMGSASPKRPASTRSMSQVRLRHQFLFRQ